MKILITGNLGYVGPVVVARLRESYADATLIGADTGFFAHCLTTREGVPERLLDVQRLVDIRRLGVDDLGGVDTVVHLAAISNDPMGNVYENVTDEINYRTTVRLARSAREAGAHRFVFASSCSVYGFSDGAPCSEECAINPLTAYARSKSDAERGLEPLADRDFVVTCLRFPTACGMSPRLRLDLVLNDFVASAVASGVIRILSDGTPWRPLIDVKDMARAIEWAVHRTAENGGSWLAVNVGHDGCNYQVKDLADAVKERVPGTAVLLNEQATADPRSYRVDFGRYADLAPEYLPRVDLSQSIEELRRGLELAKFNGRCLNDREFVRLDVLRRFRELGLLNARLEWIA